MMSFIEREEDKLYQEYECGAITKEEYEYELRELQRDYAAAAEESARNAYEDELGRW